MSQEDAAKEGMAMVMATVKVDVAYTATMMVMVVTMAAELVVYAYYLVKEEDSDTIGRYM